jgi:hypothetical protein
MRLRLLFFTLCVVAILTPSSAVAQNKRATKRTPPPSQEEMMRRWQEAMTPGDAHKALEQFVGEWDAATRMWTEGPQKPPMEATGTSSSKMELGGRFLRQDFTGQMMGMPFTGVGFTGYDNIKKKYVGSWMDSMSTALATMEGTFDKSGKILTTFGKMDDPTTGERNKTIKYVIRIVSPDKHVFEIYDLVGTKSEFKAFEITYTRRKAETAVQ